MRRPTAGLIAGTVAALLAAGTAAAWWAYHSLKVSPIPPQPTPTESVQVPQGKERAQIYWLSSQGEAVKLLPSPVILSQRASDYEVLETALNRLLASSQDSGQATAIPEGTQLLGLALEKGGVRVNLSQQFTAGGGSASMMGRLAQVLYTATSLNSNSKLWLEVEGKPLEVLGGEGLEVSQPLDRRQFEQDFELQPLSE